MDNILITPYFQKVSSLEELEVVLRKEGHKFKNKKEFVKFLYAAHKRENWSTIEKILQSEPERLSALKYTPIMYDNTECRIYGLMHDKSDIEMSTPFKKLVISEFTKFEKQGEPYLLETGLTDCFGLDEEHELPSQYRLREKFYFKLTLAENVEKAIILLSPIISMCYNIKDIDLTKASIETDSDDIIRTLIHESIKDSSTFYRTKAVVHALSLPEPFEMEAKIVRLGILNRIPLKEYSKQMTADIIEVIKLRKPKILHIGVGDDHESQITYFLNNPQK